MNDFCHIKIMTLFMKVDAVVFYSLLLTSPEISTEIRVMAGNLWPSPLL